MNSRKIKISYSVPTQDVLTLGIEDWERVPRNHTFRGSFEIELEGDASSPEDHALILEEIKRLTPLGERVVRGVASYDAVGEPEFVGRYPGSTRGVEGTHKWIKIADQPPPKNESVWLATTEWMERGHRVTLTTLWRLREREVYWDDFGNEFKELPTHWCELTAIKLPGEG